jgi:cobalt-zinc-cadmium efflux system protein
LGIVLSINLAMVVGLVVIGLLAHSLAVLAAAADYVADAAGVALSLFALHLSRRARYPRATSYAALVNASFLLIVCFVVAGEGVNRLVTGSPEIHGLPVLIISVLAAGAMLVCARILGPIDADDFNMRSVLLDTLADAAAAAGVAISGAVIFAAHGIYWLDAVVAVVISVVVGYHAVKLIIEVLRDLPEAAPRDAP